MERLDIPLASSSEESCCGGPVGPPADANARAGYSICPYVAGFTPSPVGPVPRLATRLTWRDRLGTLRARLGWCRNTYQVSPGLYCLGQPDRQAPVLVTANYKLTLDCLRESLTGVSAWILVLDTRGINVWCAAAHQTFGSAELLARLKLCGLAQVVEHRRLIVPQLGAAGVSARRVLKESGFEVVWGPLRAGDLIKFLGQGEKASAGMRELTFTLRERLVLSPVELSLAIKPGLVILLLLYGLSGISPEIFSPGLAWSRWLLVAPVFLAGLLAGTVLVPLLLPWLPFRAFYLKGVLAVLPVTALIQWPAAGASWLESIALACLSFAVSSYGAMNFTGATPYASPSGVEQEMRRGLPLQMVLLAVALILWVASPFLRGGV